MKRQMWPSTKWLIFYAIPGLVFWLSMGIVAGYRDYDWRWWLIGGFGLIVILTVGKIHYRKWHDKWECNPKNWKP